MKVAECEAKRVNYKKSFFDKIEKSSDLNDNLQDLCDYIHEITGATGVYVGKLEF